MKIADAKGTIQFFLKRKHPEDAFKLIEAIDLGDIVGASGKVYRTQRGELSIMVNVLEVLCKSILPLPEKFHGLQDIEIRQRQRYLDLIMNPEVREVFIKRTKIIQAWKEFLNNKGFLDVEIPVLQPTYGEQVVALHHGF